MILAMLRYLLLPYHFETMRKGMLGVKMSTYVAEFLAISISKPTVLQIDISTKAPFTLYRIHLVPHSSPNPISKFYMFILYRIQF